MTGIATSWTPGSTSTLRYTEIASSGHMDTYSCRTIDNDPFGACLHAWEYITESCYNSLNDSEKAKAKSRCGIVRDTGWAKPYQAEVWTYYNFDPTAIVECWNATCIALRPDLGPDPCEGVVCDPICVGLDSYAMICEEGVCVQGSLIKANDPECGYISPTPEDPTMFDVIIDNKELIIIGAIVGAVVLKSI